MARAHNYPSSRSTEPVPSWRKSIRANMAMVVDSLRDEGLAPQAIRDRTAEAARSALGLEPSGGPALSCDPADPGKLTLAGLFRAILDQPGLDRADPVFAETFWSEINAGLDRYL